MRLIRTLVVLCVLALVAAPFALALRFTDDDFDMPVGQVGVPYSKQFHGGAGCGPALPYQYRILDGKLPPGITLDESGLFSGVPTAAGSWSFWVELSDEDPPSASWCVPKQSQRQFTIAVLPRRLDAEVGRTFTDSLPSIRRAGATWALAAGSSLPDGLALDPASGVISGVPTAAGSFSLQLFVTDALGWKDPAATELAVAPQLEVAGGALRPARVGRAYSGRIAVAGGVAPYRWRLVRGALRSGIRINATTGVLHGTARRPGTYALTVRVVDRLHAAAAKAFVLRVVR
jgi:hypothetical protein